MQISFFQFSKPNERQKSLEPTKAPYPPFLDNCLKKTTITLKPIKVEKEIKLFKGLNIETELLSEDILVCEWKGSVDGRTNRKAFEFLAFHVKEKATPYILLKQKKMRLFQTDCDWVIDTFLPQHRNLLPSVVCAVVIADSFILEKKIRETMEMLFPDGSLHFALFRDDGVALKWLKDQQKTLME
jgi:hypothetical protein